MIDIIEKPVTDEFYENDFLPFKLPERKFKSVQQLLNMPLRL